MFMNGEYNPVTRHWSTCSYSLKNVRRTAKATKKTLRQDSLCCGRGLCQTPHECKSKALLFKAAFAVLDVVTSLLLVAECCKT